MGAYTEYLDTNMSFELLTSERKEILKKISKHRGNRDILVMASDLTKNGNTSIEYADVLPFSDQLSTLSGTEIDIILETPGGFAEVVEDLVKLVRDKYEKVGVIIPGYAKSAGTIFAMAADEILMGKMSALGPIDAQIASNGKRYSADAFLDGLEKIKASVISSGGRLNTALIPILQNISPGEIQHCENAQSFSRRLVTQWLSKYKFKFWQTHSSTGSVVTDEEKEQRANAIADKLCKHADWLTHGRSIKIDDFKQMKLIITDYSEDSILNDLINRYYALLRMTFESTSIYKIFETVNTQILRFAVQNNTGLPNIAQNNQQDNKICIIDFSCPNCKNMTKLQANLESTSPLTPGLEPFPVIDSIYVCKKCGSRHNLLPIRLQIEAQSGKIIVS